MKFLGVQIKSILSVELEISSKTAIFSSQNATSLVNYNLTEPFYAFVAVGGIAKFELGDLYERTTPASTKPAPTTITPKFGGIRSFNLIVFSITYLMKRLFEKH